MHLAKVKSQEDCHMKETLQDLKTRRSCRKYKPDQISEEQLN